MLLLLVSDLVAFNSSFILKRHANYNIFLSTSISKKAVKKYKGRRPSGTDTEVFDNIRDVSPSVFAFVRATNSMRINFGTIWTFGQQMEMFAKPSMTNGLVLSHSLDSCAKLIAFFLHLLKPISSCQFLQGIARLFEPFKI